MKTTIAVPHLTTFVLAIMLVGQFNLAHLQAAESQPFTEPVEETQPSRAKRSIWEGFKDVVGFGLGVTKEVLNLKRSGKEADPRYQQYSDDRFSSYGNEESHPDTISSQQDRPILPEIPTTEDLENGRGEISAAQISVVEAGGGVKLESIVANIRKAETLPSMRAAVNRLVQFVPKPSDDPAVKAAFASILSRYPSLSPTRKRAVSVVFDQLLVDCSRAGGNKAALLFSIRMAALLAACVDTSSELTDLLAERNDLRAELNDRVVSEAFSPLVDVLHPAWITYLKQLFLNWKQFGAAAAAEHFTRDVSGESQSGRNSDRSSGNSPAASPALLGTWSAVVTGEASGMSVVSYYTFLADGTYTRSSQSSFSFGATGSYIGKRGQSGGSWSLAERTLRLTPDNGRTLEFTISDLSGKGMITKLPNGSRWLWQKKQ